MSTQKNNAVSNSEELHPSPKQRTSPGPLQVKVLSPSSGKKSKSSVHSKGMVQPLPRKRDPVEEPTHKEIERDKANENSRTLETPISPVLIPKVSPSEAEQATKLVVNNNKVDEASEQPISFSSGNSSSVSEADSLDEMSADDEEHQPEEGSDTGDAASNTISDLEKYLSAHNDMEGSPEDPDGVGEELISLDDILPLPFEKYEEISRRWAEMASDGHIQELKDFLEPLDMTENNLLGPTTYTLAAVSFSSSDETASSNSALLKLEEDLNIQGLQDTNESESKETSHLPKPTHDKFRHTQKNVKEKASGQTAPRTPRVQTSKPQGNVKSSTSKPSSSGAAKMEETGSSASPSHGLIPKTIAPKAIRPTGKPSPNKKPTNAQQPKPKPKPKCPPPANTVTVSKKKKILEAKQISVDNSVAPPSVLNDNQSAPLPETGTLLQDTEPSTDVLLDTEFPPDAIEDNVDKAKEEFLEANNDEESHATIKKKKVHSVNFSEDVQDLCEKTEEEQRTPAPKAAVSTKPAHRAPLIVKETVASRSRRRWENQRRQEAASSSQNDSEYFTPLQRKENEVKELRSQLLDAYSIVEHRELELEVIQYEKDCEVRQAAQLKQEAVAQLEQDILALQQELDLWRMRTITTDQKRHNVIAVIDKVKKEQEEREKRHREMYLEMYRKGKNSILFERQVELEKLALESPEKVSKVELEEQLQKLDEEIQRWQQARLNEHYDEAKRPDTEAEAKLKFLRDPFFHYLVESKREVADAHLDTLVNMFQYSQVQMNTIHKCLESRRKQGKM